MANQDWFTGLFKTIDDMDVDAFAAYLSEGSSFTYGSQPTVEGLEGVRAAITGFFGTINGISHTLHGTWDAGDARFCQGEVTYTMPDDREVTLPFLNMFRMDGEKIREYRVYVDPTPMAG
jgi:ketosteroid isomerase-like protein